MANDKIIPHVTIANIDIQVYKKMPNGFIDPGVLHQREGMLSLEFNNEQDAKDFMEKLVDNISAFAKDNHIPNIDKSSNKEQ